jgi:hypothetical protein
MARKPKVGKPTLPKTKKGKTKATVISGIMLGIEVLREVLPYLRPRR